MQYFNFAQLVKKYERELTVIIPAKAELQKNGDWVKGEPKQITLKGAVIRHRQSKVYRSEGTLTADDCALYLTEQPNIELVGTTVISDNKKFNVESTLDNSEFTGVWSFNLKYVSAFKEGGE